jgi:hypothetical protein
MRTSFGHLDEEEFLHSLGLVICAGTKGYCEVPVGRGHLSGGH